MADITKQVEVLAFGGTGNQGGAVIRRLLASGFPVKAFVRDPSKDAAQALEGAGATLTQGDLTDRASIDEAMGGMYGVYLVLPFFTEGWEREVEMGRTVIDAAKAAGVKHFVYSSGARANLMTGVPHLDSKGEIEKHLIYSHLPYTIFRPVAFNYSLTAYRESVSQGVLPDPREPDSEVYQVAEEDYGDLVALALTDPQNWLGVDLDVAGDVLTVQEMANAFGRVLGQEVKHQPISWDEEAEMASEEVVRLTKWVADEGPSIDMEMMRRRFPWLSSVEEYLRTHGWGQTS